MGKKKRRKEKGEICWRTHGPHQCFLLPPFSFLILVNKAQTIKRTTYSAGQLYSVLYYLYSKYFI